MKIAIINGPNLNLQGMREPEVYGSASFQEMLATIRETFPQVDFEYFQSNVEGVLIDKLHEVGFSCQGIILNAGGYSHTSVALHDALAAIPAPTIEVHISNIFAREEYRHHSLLTSACRGMICGLGLDGYRLAVAALVAI
ncbi:MAG: type II 3-dehydroquinate dehydratase [Bacteroidales bacterium]|nr:type II 3-dehydroquinate dehydratase [Bacteroidales bacterium]